MHAKFSPTRTALALTISLLLCGCPSGGDEQSQKAAAELAQKIEALEKEAAKERAALKKEVNATESALSSAKRASLEPEWEWKKAKKKLAEADGRVAKGTKEAETARTDLSTGYVKGLYEKQNKSGKSYEKRLAELKARLFQKKDVGRISAADLSVMRAIADMAEADAELREALLMFKLAKAAFDALDEKMKQGAAEAAAAEERLKALKKKLKAKSSEWKAKIQAAKKEASGE